jgi:hypothetical protein
MSKSDARANSYRLSGTRLATRLHSSAIALPNILEIAMNRKLNIAIVTAASLAFVGAAQAASNKVLDQMMNTCIQQFVANNFADYQGKITIQKPDSTNHGTSLMSGGSRHQITVTAVGRPGSTQLATATCQMARDGSVVSIKTLPLAAMKKLSRIEPMIVAKNEIE